MSIKNIVKGHILQDMVSAVKSDGGNKWKVMVVDTAALRIINSVIKMTELLDADITLIEPLEKRRQPYPTMDAIYCCSPTLDSINRIIEDFTANKNNKDGRLYKAIHLFFISTLDDRLFTKLKSSSANAFIKTLKELYIEYSPLESHVFSTELKHGLITFFGTEVTGEQILKDYMAISRQLSSFCISMNEFPIIRYSCIDGFDRVTSKLASLVYEELDKYAKLDPDFPSKDPAFLNANRSVLLIVDRTVDTIAPLLHEFTYQAMANDMLKLEDGHKYKYMFESNTEGKTQKEANLDESDALWASMRHSHIAECSTTIVNSFNAFIRDNQAATGMKDQKDVANLNDLKNMLSAVPQFQDMKSKFSLHMNLAQECLQAFNKRNLAQVAAVEQDLATGETAEGAKPKNIEVQMIPLLDDENVTLYDKVRLLMLYIIGKDGLKDDDRRKLFEHAKIPPELSTAITNLALVGVKLSRTSKAPKKTKKKVKRDTDSDIPYDLSRYVPEIKNAVAELCEGTLSKEKYPFVRDPNTAGTYGSANLSAGLRAASPGSDRAASPMSGLPATSLRSTKPSWHKKTSSDASSHASDRKEPEVRKGGRVIVFVVGGATYSEVRSVYELSQTFRKDVYLGSTHISTPESYVDDLKMLKQPLVVEKMANVTSIQTTSNGSLNAATKKKSGMSGMFQKLKDKIT